MGTEVLKQPHQFHASLSALQVVELPHSSSSKAVIFGNQIDVYKSSSNVLAIDDAAVSITYNGGTNTLRLPNTTPGVGITIGGDTNLFRNAPHTLKTNDSLVVAGNLDVLAGSKILSAGVDLFDIGLGGGGGGTITGTGTNNAITKWTGTTSIGDSIITEGTGAITVAGTLSAQGIIYTQEQQVVKTPTTTMPGNSAVTSIIAVSALPVTPEIGTLYILV